MGRGDRVRYAPLAALAVVVLLVLAVLPSTLSVPQTSPSTTLEYAPVPARDSTVAPPGGNLTSLGLGGSSTLTAGTDGAGDAPGPVAAGVGKRPRTKRCVGRPARQTEDPLSPPCSAFFDGDNFGAAHRGVTRDEVRVLFAYDGGGIGGRGTSSRGAEQVPVSTYYDLGRPPESDNEFVTARVLRLYQRTFNERYQTYGRNVRFFVHFGSTTRTPEGRRADAADAFARTDPFAVVSYVGANNDAYLSSMVSRGVVSFLGVPGGTSAAVGQPSAFFRRSPGMIWSYAPDVERLAALYVSYVCRKVVGHAASFSGNAADNSRPRRLALVRTTEAGRPDYQLYASLVRSGVEACGGTFVAEGTTPFAYGCCPVPANNPHYAQEDMIRFQQAGVTTVIWVGGFEVRHSQAGAQINYRPEIVVAGDLNVEGNGDTRFQDQSAWRHARAVTTYTRLDSTETGRPCFDAAREADPAVPGIDVRHYACAFYPDVRQLFTGVQVAGPRLTPRKLDEGFHAIPAVASTSPYVEACFYEPDGYTCVKDAQAQWWDPDALAPDGQRGCYRMMQGGRRYLAGTWPDGDVEAQRRPDDPCNLQGVTVD